jgi:hypothetical protein
VFIRLEEEIQNEEDRPQKKQDKRGIDVPPRETAERTEKLGRNGLKA